MPHLISPGYAKSGTTLLHELLNSAPDFEGPKGNKERSWFRTTTEPLPYQEVFETPFSADLVSFEFSPTYLACHTRKMRRQIANRIKAELPDAFILLTIRHPLERAVSHYIHQLQRAALYGDGRWVAATRDLTRPYTKSFNWAASSDPALWSDLEATVQIYFEVFGPEKCIFFFLENDVSEFVGFYDYLRTRLGMKPDSHFRELGVPNVVNGGRNAIPRYFAGGTPSGVVETEEGSIRVPPGCLYIASELAHDVQFNLDPLTLRLLHNAQHMWTSNFDADLLQAVCQREFAQGLVEFDDLVRPHRPEMPDYNTMPLKPRSFEFVDPDLEFLARSLELREKKMERQRQVYAARDTAGHVQAS